ncbi:hypothetical protein LEP1GSC103_1996 [Leptospira borgpetersenii serovar Javanica str. UI 09931]|uniref:Uncharacterized protein n=3 Tax=Leptospira borgpetersenii TaxID=174 RepID=A0A0S2ISQ0_LEPBO|nr:hypothetical protein LBBP_02402 [Leptospira borgpetersenii serovar Ballum]EKP15488.1 hypothetical protein LEP1GSC128_0860 [Leptospira borgpetersenii str. 200801926]EKQ91702.1 hypothetical protein LEP1GSC101_0756 [Leptospira borgpetersenii str. UI 09149]EKQ99028.1 hypothetical protein LEP1GSC121_2429 [Leptospira borgpetersenii serovar Castellonis str. 200801910]EMN59888.1 hypothetical protein LEP1GSC090_2118 [Leptospira borgpetersenii serovar Javanica str. MK146]EMO09596.1 hypothetical prote
MEVISLERSFVIRKDPRNIFEFPNSACKIGLKIRLEKTKKSFLQRFTATQAT